MKKLAAIILALQLIFASPARADMFGGDVAVLMQILANALQQLAQLRNILQTGRDNVDLIRDINRGINDSLNLIRTISPNSDPGLYKDWDKVSEALNKLEAVYGIAIESRDLRVQKDTDQSVAEAVALNNSIYKYTTTIDQIGELIKSQSHSVSPGGAAKLTAQSLGVMLNLQNEMLRTQATGLKLQAQALALQNRKDKERTRQMVAGADGLNSALGGAKPEFKLPRFE
ncbi:MAG: hypothetical protein HYX41_05220 [Bdellovibrio sp.]|nr:hypothetical protein [Bdellovibrio sp.]